MSVDGRLDVVQDDDGRKIRTVSPGLISVGLVLIPNAMMMRSHINGGTVKIVNWVIASRFPGPPGLLLVPFAGLALEKVFYDTAMSIQGVDPNAARADRKDEGFPAGGHAFPSLSVLPVRNLLGSWGAVPPPRSVNDWSKKDDL
jgi:hypothetical protein